MGPVGGLVDPLLLRGWLTSLGKDVDVQRMIEDAKRFQAKFESSTLRAQEGRAERVLKGPGLVAIESCFKQVVLEDARPPFASMASEAALAAFGVVKQV